jgi:phosphoglycolate phosphatase-like HAD superfamily hydrolase
MVGDSISDMLFGKNLGMKTIFVGKKSENNKLDRLIYFDSLLEFYRSQIV